MSLSRALCLAALALHASASVTCRDRTINGQPWRDDRYSDVTCEGFSTKFDYCEDGDINQYMGGGMTVYEACCACGGGDLSGDLPEVNPIPVEPVGTYCLNTAPHNHGYDERHWRAPFNPSVTCDSYTRGEAQCEDHAGQNFFELTNRDACCACGGGWTTTATPAPTVRTKWWVGVRIATRDCKYCPSKGSFGFKVTSYDGVECVGENIVPSDYNKGEKFTVFAKDCPFHSYQTRTVTITADINNGGKDAWGIGSLELSRDAGHFPMWVPELGKSSANVRDTGNPNGRKKELVWEIDTRGWNVPNRS